MYTVELYARVRRAVHVEGRSQREVAREFGLARKTVRKMLEYPVPPGYQRQKPVRRRSWDRGRLPGYAGGYTIVKDYVRQSKLGARETSLD